MGISNTAFNALGEGLKILKDAVPFISGFIDALYTEEQKRIIMQEFMNSLPELVLAGIGLGFGLYLLWTDKNLDILFQKKGNRSRRGRVGRGGRGGGGGEDGGEEKMEEDEDEGDMDGDSDGNGNDEDEDENKAIILLIIYILLIVVSAAIIAYKVYLIFMKAASSSSSS
ncbi:MAG: hypothetical protein QXI43_00180 [Candidatus Nitrosocaldus sp.]